MTLLATERREMTGPIHHSKYRVLPHHWSRGFYYGICKECPPDEAYTSARSINPLICERSVVNHLKDRHGIEVDP